MSKDTELRRFDVNDFVTRSNDLNCVSISNADLDRLSTAEVSRMPGLEDELQRLHVQHDVLRSIAAQRLGTERRPRQSSPTHSRSPPRPKPVQNAVQKSSPPPPKRSQRAPISSVVPPQHKRAAFSAGVGVTADFEDVMAGRHYHLVEQDGGRRKGRWTVAFHPSNRIEWRDEAGKEVGGVAEWDLLQGVTPDTQLAAGAGKRSAVPWRVFGLVWAEPKGSRTRRGLPVRIEATSDEDYRSSILVLQYFLRLSGPLRGKPKTTYDDLVQIQRQIKARDSTLMRLK